MLTEHLEVVMKVRDVLVVGVPVVNTEPATHIDASDRILATFEESGEFVDAITQCHEVNHVQYLRAYVKMYAHKVDMRQGDGLLDDSLYLFEVYTELILGQTCGNVAVCVPQH